jgi:hypothetical protein
MSDLHIRYNGVSYDEDLNALDLGDMSTDEDIRQAALERNVETGDVTLRPQAIFG